MVPENWQFGHNKRSVDCLYSILKIGSWGTTKGLQIGYILFKMFIWCHWFNLAPLT